MKKVGEGGPKPMDRHETNSRTGKAKIRKVKAGEILIRRRSFFRINNMDGMEEQLS